MAFFSSPISVLRINEHLTWSKRLALPRFTEHLATLLPPPRLPRHARLQVGSPYGGYGYLRKRIACASITF